MNEVCREAHNFAGGQNCRKHTRFYLLLLQRMVCVDGIYQTLCVKQIQCTFARHFNCPMLWILIHSGKQEPIFICKSQENADVLWELPWRRPSCADVTAVLLLWLQMMDGSPSDERAGASASSASSPVDNRGELHWACAFLQEQKLPSTILTGWQVRLASRIWVPIYTWCSAHIESKGCPDVNLLDGKSWSAKQQRRFQISCTCIAVCERVCACGRACVRAKKSGSVGAWIRHSPLFSVLSWHLNPLFNRFYRPFSISRAG